MRRIAEAKTWAHECRSRSSSVIAYRSSKVLRCSDIFARSGSYTGCLGKLARILHSENVVASGERRGVARAGRTRAAISCIDGLFNEERVAMVSIRPNSRFIAMNLINVAIFGASGYSGEELVRRLAQHPRIRIVGLTSRQHVGKKASDLFPWLDPHSPVADLRFISPDAANLTGEDVAAVFLALPHGVASEFAVPLLDAGIRVLDLSADFRTRDPEAYREFYHREHPAKALLSRSVYGLAEIHRDQIRKAELVACPGCYPTGILLPVLPLIRSGLIRADSVIATSMSGVSGADSTHTSGYNRIGPNQTRSNQRKHWEEDAGRIASGTGNKFSFTNLIAVDFRQPIDRSAQERLGRMFPMIKLAIRLRISSSKICA